AEVWKRSFGRSLPSVLHSTENPNEFYVGTHQLHRINARDGSTIATVKGVSGRSQVSAFASFANGTAAVAMTHAPMQLLSLSDPDAEVVDTGIAPSFRCHRVAFSKDGKRLYFSKGGMNRVRPAFVVWNVEEKSVERELFPRGPEMFGSVDVSPRNGIVAVAGDAIYLYDPVASDWVTRSVDLPSMPLDLEFHPSGDRLACSCKDGSLIILGVTEDSKLKVLHSIKCSDIDLTCVTWAGKNQVIAGDENGKVKLQKLPQPFKRLAEFTGYASMIRNGQWMLSQPDGNTIKLLECETLKTIFETNELDGKRIDTCAANSSGTHFTVVSGKTAWVWELGSQSLIGKFDHDPIRETNRSRPWRMRRVALDDYGHVATTGHVGNDFSVQVRDVSDLSRRIADASFNGLTVGVDFSTDGKRMAVTHFDGLSLFELDGMKRTDLNGYRGTTTWLSPTRLLMRDRAKSFYVYDLESNSFTHTFGSGKDAHPAGTFVPLDERTLLTQGFDGLRLWDWESQRHLGFIPISAWQCGRSPDGTRLWLLEKSDPGGGGSLIEMRLR
ncbi:MAG: WD40 repeat domain-containing protein, partial [Planctomycetota bacterium]